jgi:hypothetical protein
MDTARYCWISAQNKCREYAFLAEIALRIEPAICSEASVEPAIGEQRQFLMSHRARTNTDLVLARTTMENHWNQTQRSAIKHKV